MHTTLIIDVTRLSNDLQKDTSESFTLDKLDAFFIDNWYLVLDAW